MIMLITIYALTASILILGLCKAAARE